jgi:hypothetical protein
MRVDHDDFEMGIILCAGAVKMHLAAIDITQLAGGVRGFRQGEECVGICDFLNRGRVSHIRVT